MYIYKYVCIYIYTFSYIYIYISNSTVMVVDMLCLHGSLSFQPSASFDISCTGTRKLQIVYVLAAFHTSSNENFI